MRSVVFVDDELSILDGLRRGLRGKRSEWDQHFYTKAEEALKFVEANPVDVVVSDMRMPGMNGAEFLQAVQKARPKAVRLALSGYADSQLILESAHAIHQHISKPAKIHSIVETIEHSIALQAKLTNPALQAYVGSLKALPTMPHVYDEIMKLVSGESYTEDEIVGVISKDLGLTATVLRIVNSDFFGNFGNINSIRQAVSMLGTETVKNIVLSENLTMQFEYSNPAKLAELNALSNSVSAMAHKFAATVDLGERERDHCQLAGIVCTLGDMVALDAGDPGNGITSPEITAYMLNLWSMPDSLVESVLLHRVEVDMSYEGRPEPVTAADCVRAAWFACKEYLPLDGIDRSAKEESMRKLFRVLSKDSAIADKWDNILSTFI